MLSSAAVSRDVKCPSGVMGEEPGSSPGHDSEPACRDITHLSAGMDFSSEKQREE